MDPPTHSTVTRSDTHLYEENVFTNKNNYIEPDYLHIKKLIQ
jgi:hypothetical protein